MAEGAGCCSCCESCSNNAPKHNKFTHSEMEAAHQLMQLSDEENSSGSNIIRGNHSNKKRKKKKKIVTKEEEEVIMAKIQEIFGIDIDDDDDAKKDVFQNKKKKKQKTKYRTLANIFNATCPIAAPSLTNNPSPSQN